MTGAQDLKVVAIHGAPRSGTSWLGQLFNSSEHVAYRYQPMFSYAFKDRLNDHSSAVEIDQFFDDLLATSDDFVLQRGSASLSGYCLEFQKSEVTHLVYKEVRYHHLLEHLLTTCSRMHVIALVRDPRAVMHSWFRAPKEFELDWNPFEEWRNGLRKNNGKPENWYGYERWKELAQLFLRLKRMYPLRVEIVRYESLVSDPIRTLSDLYQTCGLQMTKQVESFISESRARNDDQPYGVFRRSRSTTTAWLGQLPSQISHAIESDLDGTHLQQFLLEVDSICEPQR
jgi:hypothetical protein